MWFLTAFTPHRHHWSRASTAPLQLPVADMMKLSPFHEWMVENTYDMKPAIAFIQSTSTTDCLPRDVTSHRHQSSTQWHRRHDWMMQMWLSWWSMPTDCYIPVAPHQLPVADVMKLSPFRLRVDRFLKLNDCLYTTHATQHNRTSPLSLQYLTVTIMQSKMNDTTRETSSVTFSSRLTCQYSVLSAAFLQGQLHPARLKLAVKLIPEINSI